MAGMQMRNLLRRFDARPAVAAPKPARDVFALELPDGQAVDVLRVRHPRARRFKLSVDERGARLTVPERASLAAGERFAIEHAGWLQAQLRQLARDSFAPLEAGVTAALPLRGDAMPLRWASGRVCRLHAGDDGLRFDLPASAGPAALRRALRDFYESQGRADVGRWLPKYIPGLPRPPRRIVFKRTSSLWGSLAPDGTLALDLALVLARPAAFEYVLVHELCHLLHADHSRAFWREVGARCPNWRRERSYLLDEGRRLKGALRVLLSGSPGSSR